MTYRPFASSGSVALVTGGNSGIGLGMARAVAEADADVAIWGTNPAKNEAARDELARTGRRVLALPCDVGDEAAVEAACAETLRVMGRVDACFANAGTYGGGRTPFVEHGAEEWRRVLRVNLDGAFYTLCAAARHMVERGGGGPLVGTASLAAIEGAARNEHHVARAARRRVSSAPRPPAAPSGLVPPPRVRRTPRRVRQAPDIGPLRVAGRTTPRSPVPRSRPALGRGPFSTSPRSAPSSKRSAPGRFRLRCSDRPFGNAPRRRPEWGGGAGPTNRGPQAFRGQ